MFKFKKMLLFKSLCYMRGCKWYAVYTTDRRVHNKNIPDMDHRWLH